MKTFKRVMGLIFRLLAIILVFLSISELPSQNNSKNAQKREKVSSVEYDNNFQFNFGGADLILNDSEIYFESTFSNNNISIYPDIDLTNQDYNTLDLTTDVFGSSFGLWYNDQGITTYTGYILFDLGIEDYQALFYNLQSSNQYLINLTFDVYFSFGSGRYIKRLSNQNQYLTFYNDRTGGAETFYANEINLFEYTGDYVSLNYMYDFTMTFTEEEILSIDDSTDYLYLTINFETSDATQLFRNVYENGVEYGREIGYDDGYNVGYDDGERDGFTLGTENVVNSPNDYGLYTLEQYNQNYVNGFEAAKSQITGLVWVEETLKTTQRFLDIRFFPNITLGHLVGGMLIVELVIWFIRWWR